MLLSKEQVKRIENSKRLKLKALKNAKIKGGGGSDFFGIVLVIVGVGLIALGIGLFLAGAIPLLTALLMVAFGLLLVLIGLLMLINPKIQSSMGNRGAPAYGQFSNDPVVYGSGKPISQIIGISKVGAIVVDKKIFGDYNSYGQTSGIVADKFGIQGVLGIYDKEKIIQAFNTPRTSAVLQNYNYPNEVSRSGNTYVYDLFVAHPYTLLNYMKMQITYRFMSLNTANVEYLSIRDFFAVKYLSRNIDQENTESLKVIKQFLDSYNQINGQASNRYKYIYAYVYEPQYISQEATSPSITITTSNPSSSDSNSSDTFYGGLLVDISGSSSSSNSSVSTYTIPLPYVSPQGYTRVFMNFNNRKSYNDQGDTLYNTNGAVAIDRPGNEDFLQDINISIGYQSRTFYPNYRRLINDPNRLQFDANVVDFPGDGQVEQQPSGLTISASNTDVTYKVAFGAINIYNFDSNVNEIIAQQNVQYSFSAGGQQTSTDIIIKNRDDDSVVSVVNITTSELHNGGNCNNDPCIGPSYSTGCIHHGGSFCGNYYSGRYIGPIYDLNIPTSY